MHHHAHHWHHSFGGGSRSRHHSGRGGLFGSPFGGGFRGGGPGMRAAKMLASGDLQLIILLLLSEKPRHGYEIIKGLEEHSSGVYTPSPGMVYPALTYIEEMGYAAAATEGAKKLYSITPEGSAYLAANQEAAREIWNHLALFGRKMAHFQRQFTEDENVADSFGSPGGRTRGERHEMKAEFYAVRDELKAALYEKIHASLEEKQRVLAVLRRAIDEIRSK
jgi:DNA-binding PadR family transcriptional regulator